MSYTSPVTLNTDTGNNAFSYAERVARNGKAELIIPSLQEIRSLEEVQLGKEVVFEEIDHQGRLRSCTGLAHVYKYLPDRPGRVRSYTTTTPLPPIYIFDNHNHALYFWTLFAQGLPAGQTTKLLHIDQHSDLQEPPQPIDHEQIHDLNYLRSYTHQTCNVGNFITPFLSAFPFTSFEWIKAEQQMLFYSLHLGMDDQLILDIDLDFWAPEMSLQQHTATILKVQELVRAAQLVTIATSPYFLEQPLALSLLHELLG